MLDIKLLCGGERTDHFYHWFLSAKPEPAAQLVRHIHAATLGLYDRMKGVGGRDRDLQAQRLPGLAGVFGP